MKIAKTIEDLLQSQEANRLNLANNMLAVNLIIMGKIRYALYAAEQCLPIYEKSFPDDKRLRNLLEIPRAYLTNKKQEKFNSAEEAETIAYGIQSIAPKAAAKSSANAIIVYNCAISSMTEKYAAEGFNYASNCAAGAVYFAGCAAYAEDGSGDEMKTKIINYGLTLL